MVSFPKTEEGRFLTAGRLPETYPFGNPKKGGCEVTAASVDAIVLPGAVPTGVFDDFVLFGIDGDVCAHPLRQK